VDSDGDGIPDGEDECPGVAETPNGYRDDDGCPDSEPLTTDSLIPGKTIVLEGVEFREASATVTPRARGTLLAAVQTLRDNPDVRVEIGGHTDDRGDAEANRELSLLRAEAVKLFFVGEGIDAVRLSTKGYGEDMPRANNATSEGRAKNRRIELKVLAAD
jgi:outer membrane protein OmpA-like peptidoglycan-associated protein